MTTIAQTSRFDAQGNLKPLRETTETDVTRKPCGTLHYSPNYMGNLMVVKRCSVNDGAAELVCLSADGRDWIGTWHEECDGPEAGGVYVEKHTADGCVFHGWVDSASRRIVQIG